MKLYLFPYPPLCKYILLSTSKCFIYNSVIYISHYALPPYLPPPHGKSKEKREKWRQYEVVKKKFKEKKSKGIKDKELLGVNRDEEW